ncbi:MAG: type II toxin-antitoxin system HicB family antitoxin [Candidatus Micrarchaeaceae archaeon]
MNGVRVFRSEGWYVAEIPSLHVVTRARNPAQLKKNLKEAIEVAVDGLLELQKMKMGRSASAKVRGASYAATSYKAN